MTSAEAFERTHELRSRTRTQGDSSDARADASFGPPLVHSESPGDRKALTTEGARGVQPSSAAATCLSRTIGSSSRSSRVTQANGRSSRIAH